MTLHPDEQARELRNRIAGEFHLSGQCGSDGGTFEEVLKSGYECVCYEAADLMLPFLAKARLAEAEWWAQYSGAICRGKETCKGCARIASLRQRAAAARTGDTGD